MRSLILASARQVIGNQDRSTNQGEDSDFERSQHAANGDVYREACDDDKTAEETRRNEGAVARGCEYILLRRRIAQAHRHNSNTGVRKLTVPSHVFAEQTRPNSLQTLGHSRLANAKFRVAEAIAVHGGPSNPILTPFDAHGEISVATAPQARLRFNSLRCGNHTEFVRQSIRLTADA